MQTLARYFQRPHWRIYVFVAVLLALGLFAGTSPAHAAEANCALAGTTRTCELWATTGSVTMPDGATVTVWGYANTAGGPAQLPGPTIVANEGETLVVILHNGLGETTSLAFRGFPVSPDTVGVGAGLDNTLDPYSLTNVQPGTYMYEAGLTTNGPRQVAMGMFGALIVRPAMGANYAYNDADTAFDTEAILVLSEIDPAFNANPATFDMTLYAPKYFLINGEAYPDTNPIAVEPADKVLIRYLDGGLQSHSMGLLGLGQTIIGGGGSQLAHPYSVVNEIVSPGQTLEAMVTVPATASTATKYPLFEAIHMDNNGQSFGGMITFLEVAAPTVTVTVVDTNGLPQAGLPVYAFDDTNYTGISGTTDANGQTTLTLPVGNYRFATDKFSIRYYSGPANHCAVPTCKTAQIVVPVFGAVTVTVQDSNGTLLANQVVYAFNGPTYMGFSATTGILGEAATFNLPEGDYRFATDIDSTRYYSGAINTCLAVGTPVTGCTTDSITIPVYGQVAVTVADANGLLANQLVYAFNDATYTGLSATTGPAGEAATFNLPAGDYRFATDDVNGTRYYSGSVNTCTVPTCVANSITLPVFGAVAVTVQDTGGAPFVGQVVYAFNNTTYTGILATTDGAGLAIFNLPAGDYRFATDFNATRYYSDVANHCTVPGCISATITIPVYSSVTVTVADTNGAPLVSQVVYAFDGPAYIGFSTMTDGAGVATFNLPAGDYRFATDVNNTRYYSGAGNTCLGVGTPLTGCTTDSITIPVYGSVTVTVADANGPLAGQLVYAFNGPTYMGFSATTDALGQAIFNLPAGDYRFATDVNSTRYYSGPANTCLGVGTLGGCAADTITIPVYGSVTVTVADANGPLAGQLVYAFNGPTYMGFSATTDALGQAILNLPAGDYRFATDVYSTRYYSGAGNTCAVPTCTTDSITIPLYGQVAVLVQDGTLTPLVSQVVYAFDGPTYMGFSATTGPAGEAAIFNLPAGNYRFATDVGSTRYYSSDPGNSCTVVGCTNDIINIP